MTALSSDSANGLYGRRQLSYAERDLLEPQTSRQDFTAPPPTPLDVFLNSEPRVWGGPGDDGGEGFAALRFDATPTSVTRTRSFLRSTLTQWRLPELVDDATTIAAELVANAVTHALRPGIAPPHAGPGRAERPTGSGHRPSAWIALVRTDQAVVCAVADPSPQLPEMSEPELFAESGRGLHIVAELSETWGHSQPEAAGKTVWARLASGR
ncbi:ATP-binding protein [Streptomyces sp. V4-01]|uniref:ATP-binding protein n=1 Tax=Actinacidiphila polyblastidii TaxID=3110430 RepID=A0ABU7PGC3_9ACTN|nr:ATP-binding protein [Streptomyces sp. V4-01]